ncbi:DUF2269 family protein [Mycobacteroides abscessus subsp. abscessus]|uniref:DUF2269 family protein n=1 Tax=Mycobacteroides abscessus TaxID=36809 RepID=UPI000929CFD3|nr:DUF2269 family protein [Mycobacteroides abscessus]MDO3108629.1 DUF2269 family protein [Mycobacteroides abscessus subsp. abscessus]SIC92739.1 Hypothetical conserved integral membrane protein [Mycobacteroides abscessus subsp. abscessus]SIE09029.1 Hypothetical conserved integral membrane protein [Mycobacteroides abscessus subsp. abscessus]SIE30894.1 Hypothetical conserved integral membrane protein [Mycobacteroides abscessus subsp. abscessus]SKJ04083.1 Hypothetical conserved integral membrane p
MTKLLLSIHVLAVILAVGPIAVAASMFPAFARRAAAEGGAELGSLRTLYRVCRVYAVVGIAIPMFGLPLADLMGVLASPWLIASLVLTGAAAAVLVFVVLPRQQRVLAELGGGHPLDARVFGRLAMFTGIFNLLWAVVTVLMIVRPGSSTGV